MREKKNKRINNRAKHVDLYTCLNKHSQDDRADEAGGCMGMSWRRWGGRLFEMSERVIGVRIGEVIDAATGGRES